MKTFFSATLILSTLSAAAVWAASPVSNLSVTLRGKKYEITDGVSTVEELQERLSEASGVTPKQQGRVLFSGKSLSKSDALSDVGVKDGDQLNMIPGGSKKKSSSSSSSKSKSSSSSTAAAATAAATPTTDDLMTKMKSNLAESGMDTSKLDDLMKQMGGDGSPSMAESMEQMSSLMKSPMFQEMLSDPEKLEQSRQMILTNPMLKSMMSSMPGMEELLNDPVAWREAMQAVAKMYENMDPDELMQSMMGGGAGAGGMPPGLFDGMTPDTSAKLALDELDEDD
mmetsp:Transcript_24714/g.69380  ORF Transcript_24714/g.69380 Transcript_24714/m.69380 type:complete len:283 (+) Transcript_24714:64-912(+)